MIFRRRIPQLPSSLPLHWFDTWDTSTLKTTGGAPITDGATVIEWLNKGTSSTKFIKLGSRSTPVYRQSGVGGKPGIYFNGSSTMSISSTAEWVSLSGVTAICVWSIDTVTRNFERMLHCYNNSGNGPLFGFATNKSSNNIGWLSNRVAGNQWAYGAAISPMPPANQAFISAGSSNYATGQSYYCHNGIFVRKVSGISDTGVTSADPPVVLSIGWDARNATGTTGGSSWCYGYLREYIAWPEYMSPSQLVPWLHYLRIKHGIEPDIPELSGLLSTTPILNCESCEEPLNEVGMCDSCYSNEEM